VECAVAFLILGMAVSTVAPLVILTIKAYRSTERTLIASQLSNELMEEVRLRKWDEAALSKVPGYPAPSRSTLGADAGETSTDKTTFDDIDDFDGWSESPPQDPVGRPVSSITGFERTVTVEYVDSSLDASGSPTDYKLVTACAQETGVTRTCVRWVATNP